MGLGSWLVKFSICGAVIISLSACASENVGKGLSTLRGQNINQAITILGYPSDQKAVPGGTFYAWEVK